MSGSVEREFEYKRKEIHCRDEEADIYDFKLSSYRISTEIALIFRNFEINHRDLMLEVGSGTGRLTVEFTKKGPEVVALDYSLNSLQINKSRCKCHVVLADLCFLPFKDSVFDKVASISVFQHIPTIRSRIAALKEIRRVSKKEAKFLITVYNNRLWDKIRHDKQGFHKGKGLIYYYRFDISELKQMLLSVFSKIVDTHSLILEKTPVLSSPLRFLCRIGLAKIAFSFEVLIGKLPLFRLLGDHILSICKS